MTVDRSALRGSLRKSLRKNRRALSARHQIAASTKLYQQVLRQPYFHAARHIAFYLPVDGEIDPSRLLRRALQERKICYLPVIRPRSDSMEFIRFDAQDTLQRNRWGIRQPRLNLRKRIAPWALDLVFVPLAGFDSACARLGMGRNVATP